MADPTQSPAPDRPEGPGRIDDVRSALARLGARARAALLAQRTLLIVAGVIAATIALAASDYLLRFPRGLRMVHFVAGAAVVGWFAWRLLGPAWRFRPSPTAVALRIERRAPELEGVLASGVEFASHGDASVSAGRAGLSGFLQGRVVEQARSAWSPRALSGALRLERLGRAAALCAIAGGVALAVAAARPDLAAIGAARTLAPWADADWPKRTELVDVTEIAVHPLGAAVPLRAALVKSNRPDDRTDVSARYRLIGADGQTTPSRRALMTWQERDVEAPAPDDEESASGRVAGALFERLIEADAEFVEYRFETFDDATAWRRIRLVAPPAVVSASATITAPEYAAAVATLGAEGDNAGASASAGVRDMGPGRDERAVAPRALAGSDVELRLTLNKPTPATPESAEWIALTFGEGAPGAGIEVSVDSERPTEWTLRWKLEDSLRLAVALVDEHGISAVDEAVYRFDAVQDRAPAATVTAPESDRGVLATAVVGVVGEGRDDVGLRAVWIERQRARPAGAPGRQPSGPGGAVEAVEEPVEIARVGAEGRRTAQASAPVDLSVLGLRPGDELWLTALAADVYAIGGEARDATRSAVRKLRIISEAELIEEVRRDLAAVRQAAIRIHEQQGQIRTRMQRAGADGAARRGQAQVSERIARQTDSVQALRERTRSNGLNDQTLDGLLRDAQAALDAAGGESEKAAQEIDRAAGPREGAEDEEREQDPGAQGARQPTQSGAPRAAGERARPESRVGEDGQSPDRAGERSETQGEQSGAQGEQGEQATEGADPQSRSEGAQSPQSGAQPREGGQPGERAEQSGGEQAGRAQSEREGDEPGEEQPRDESASPLPQELAEKIDHAQAAVQEELQSLIEMLDRGEDSWVMRRQIEGLLEQQREIREATARAGAETAGRAASELSEKELTELERIVQQQREAAERAAEMAEQLTERSEQLREKDPAAAAGMAEAARTAQESQTAQTMQQAAEQASRNQMASAGQSQDQAIEDLEEMLENLDQADRAREEALKRMLASLIESLEALARRQQLEITALDNAAQQERFTGLDQGMIRLNQNTLGVLDMAKNADRALAPVANLVGQASEAQTRAIVGLRRSPIEVDRVMTDEKASLDLLRRAKEQAEKIASELAQQQQDRQRRELRREYRERLEEQVAIRAETAPLAAAAAALDRRERATLRGLAERQEALREAVAAMVERTAELSDAKIFEYAHRRIDGHAGAAAGRLRDAEPAPALPPQDGVISMLQGLVSALDDRGEQGEFNEGAGGASGGGGSQGGQQPLIPPLAELRLLRQIQADLAQRTRGMAESGRAITAEDVDALGAEQRELGDLGQDLVERMSPPQDGAGSGI